VVLEHNRSSEERKKDNDNETEGVSQSNVVGGDPPHKKQNDGRPNQNPEKKHETHQLHRTKQEKRRRTLTSQVSHPPNDDDVHHSPSLLRRADPGLE
jgi:hypothetical protein